jgi:hypothetical protein
MPVLSFRVEKETFEKLKQYAAALDTSTSSALRDMIYRELDCAPPPKRTPPPPSDEHIKPDGKAFLLSEIKHLRHEQNNVWAHIEELTCRIAQLQQHLNTLPGTTPLPATPPVLPPPAKEPPVSEYGHPGGRLFEDKKRIRPPLPIETIPLSEIIVPPRFVNSPPQQKLVQKYRDYYDRYGRFNRRIMVTKDTLSLVDGYLVYLAAQKMGLKEVVVHVLP